MLSTHLLAFCASYFLIAVSPGLCMMLALSLGVSIGVRRARRWPRRRSGCWS